MWKRGLRLTSVAYSAASRQLGAAVSASSHPLAAEVPLASQLLHDPKLLAWTRPFATGLAAPGSPALSPDLQAEVDHATGLEREELMGELQGKPRFDLAPPQGPFGTAASPALVESYYDERLVGCSGGIGEEEHDVVWFSLKKGQPHECSVCGQVFQLKVVGEGGPPGGHH